MKFYIIAILYIITCSITFIAAEKRNRNKSKKLINRKTRSEPHIAQDLGLGNGGSKVLVGVNAPKAPPARGRPGMTKKEYNGKKIKKLKK